MTDPRYMRLALRLAQRGYGTTSPNPMVGAVLVKRGEIIGRGWHQRAGQPHAEIEAIADATEGGSNPRGATLYVTLEPCCTWGRTPPCTDAIVAAGIRNVVVGATDPNPRHSGKAFGLLRRAGLSVTHGVLAPSCARLNEPFNHWIAQRTPFVTVKAAMTLDGKIATADGQSKWITGEPARAHGMRLRQGSDAVLVGINTVLADDPSLTLRPIQSPKSKVQSPKLNSEELGSLGERPALRRIILDSLARTPLTAKVVSDGHAELTTLVVSEAAPKKRVAALAARVRVLVAPPAAPTSKSKAQSPKSKVQNPTPATRLNVSLPWLLKTLGTEQVTSLLVEGGGEVSASFLFAGLAQRIAFFYAPKVLGGRESRRAVAGDGAQNLEESLNLTEVEWRWFGPDLFLTARVLPAA